MRLPRVRFTVRGLMVVVAFLAFSLWWLIVRPKDFDRLASYHQRQLLNDSLWLPMEDPPAPRDLTLRGAWHRDMSYKYAYAAREPLFPVPPDPPQPSLEDDAESSRRAIKARQHAALENGHTWRADYEDGLREEYAESVRTGNVRMTRAPESPAQALRHRELAKYHRALKEKYERAALFPRLPVVPDPPCRVAEVPYSEACAG